MPTVVVAGNGAAATLAALALAQAIPTQNITLLELPSPPDPCDHCTRLWPTSEALHARIGLSDPLLKRHAGASLHRTDRFADWPSRQPWHLPVDAEWIDGGTIRQWLREPGMDIGAWLVAQTPIIEPPLRIEPQQYRALLQRALDSKHVRRRRAKSFGIERKPSGDVAALCFGDERFRADWFIDATGPAALLTSQLGQAAADQAVVHATDLVAVGKPGPDHSSSTDDWRAIGLGWHLRIPGSQDTVLMGFADETVSRDQAGEIYRRETGAEISTWIAVPGHLRPGWTQNVLALGAASFTPDPIARLDLALVHATLLRLLANLPGPKIIPVQRAECNRHIRADQDAAMDYALLLSQIERSGPFWQRAAALTPSDRLFRMRDQFARRGRLPPTGQTVVPDGHWRALLAARGYHPRHSDAAFRSTHMRADPAVEHRR